MHPVVSPRRSPRQEFAKTSWSPTESPLANGDVDHKRGDSGNDSNSPDSASTNGDCAKISSSLKSQTDSGIGQEDIMIAQQQHSKAAQVKMRDVDSPSSESEIGAPSTEQQLQYLLSHKKVKNPKEEQIRGEARKQRTSSNRSVTSIEMEGDNLVVVTEEIDDDTAFLDNEDGSSAPALELNGKHNDDTSPESMSLSSDSTYPSPTGDHYHKMLEELSGQKCGPGARDPDMDKLKDMLELKLDLQETQPDLSSTGSTPTSGPDSSPPTPVTPPSPPDDDSPLSPSSPTTVTYNMQFPNNSVTYNGGDGDMMGGGAQRNRTAKEQCCGVFSVDLGK